MDEARFHDELRRYWDEIARGGPATPGALDPEVAAIIRRLHAVPDVPPPDPVMARRRREDLMHATAIPVTLPPSTPPTANGLRPPRPAILGRRAIMPRTGGFSALGTMLLLLLTVAVIVIAFRWLPDTPVERSAVLPIMVATPATPTATATAEEMLVAAPVPPEWLPETVYGGQNSYTMPPGISGTWDPARVSSTCCTGPRLNYVLDGTFTMRSEGLMQILRQGSDTWEEIAPETEVALNPGDALLSRMADGFEATNPGPDPAELLDGVLFAGDAGTDPIPLDRTGAQAWKYIDQDITFSPQPVPAGPVVLRLRQIDLAKGEVLPRPESAVVQLGVSLDPGAVVLTDSPSGKSPHSLANLGERSTTVYVLTLEGAASGTPTPK